MHLEFYGAAEGVTGSLHRIHVQEQDILLDCGLFQGRREQTHALNRDLPKWATGAKALVLSHAHLDHSGNIPTLVARGFAGNVYTTPPTRDLCAVMLRDSAMIQMQDAAYLNKRNARDGIEKHIEPLYTAADVQAAMGRMISVPLRRPIPVAQGVTVTFYNSGHVLGSALVVLDLEERGRRARLLFTGDLGRDELPLLRNPEIVDGVDHLLIESTYGDRTHPDIATMDEQLGNIVRETVGRGGRVYIPTFALERAQEVLFSLERLHEKNAIPDVPIYIDSPLAIAITEIYKLHVENLAEAIQQRFIERNDPFSPPGLRYVSDVEASKRLQGGSESCIVIAGSGMCEGGRIVHHFTRALGHAKNSVVIVGFMADHTLGRRLVEGHRKVKVFGLEREVFAEVHKINGLSAHADRDDLVDFVDRTRKAGHVRTVSLVHGEDGPRLALKEALKAQGVNHVVIAKKGERVEL
ncbi:MAG: MBL fold metallo-hydrolase [Deltaproteobacteria bacterium]|jgi:metallo-beta-lactamase family protein